MSSLPLFAGRVEPVEPPMQTHHDQPVARPSRGEGLSSPPSPRRSGRLIALSLGSVALVGLGAWLTFGGREEIPAPLRQIIAFEGAVASGDYGVAHGMVDYALRLDEVLEDFWRSGQEADRAALVALSQGMLEETSVRLWPECCAGREMVRSLKRTSEEDVVWVESRPVGGGAADFAWLYRLHRRDEGWRITQREYLKDQTPSDSTRFWPMARKAVAKRLGRDPTLTEFQANLRSVMPHLTMRAYRVPDREVLEQKRREGPAEPLSPEGGTAP